MKIAGKFLFTPLKATRTIVLMSTQSQLSHFFGGKLQDAGPVLPLLSILTISTPTGYGRYVLLTMWYLL